MLLLSPNISDRTARERESWRQLHARPFRRDFDPLAERFYLHRTFPASLPCGDCRKSYLEHLAANPPDLSTRDRYFNWTVALHNWVNRKLGKVELDPGTARRIMRRHQRGEPAGERLLLRFRDCPGDGLMLAAAVRDLHRAAPGRFEIFVAGHHPALWANNPNVMGSVELNAAAAAAGFDGVVKTIDCGYPLVHQSNQRPYHFIHGYAQDLEAKLGLRIPITEFKGDVHLSPAEMSEELVAGFDVRRHYWVMAAAGGKSDYTAKWANPEHLQSVVDHFASRGVTFVQVGQRGEYNAELRGVVDLVGQTSLRDLLRLIYHSRGVVSLVSFAMHAAAAVRRKPGMPALRPCVVIAGGREAPHWEAYPGHQFLGSVGTLPCCPSGGCWRNKAYVPPGDKDPNRCEMPVDVPGRAHRGLPLKVAGCIDRIGAPEIIWAIERYYDGGVLSYPGAASETVTQPTDIYPVDRPIRVGLVIGTRGAAPYVHLGLESIRRHHPELDVLVRDDASDAQRELAALCLRYGAEYRRASSPAGHERGDMLVVRDGLVWAAERGIDLLVKFSRRWIPTTAWLSDLVDLAHASQAHTFSASCMGFGFGFRTECFAAHVPSWIASGAVDRIEAAVNGPPGPILVEAFIDGVSQGVDPCERFRRYAEAHPLTDGHTNYAQWPLLGTSRLQPPPGVLWHNAHGPERYHALAHSWGLDYPIEAFGGLSSHEGK